MHFYLSSRMGFRRAGEGGHRGHKCRGKAHLAGDEAVTAVEGHEEPLSAVKGGLPRGLIRDVEKGLVVSLLYS